MKISNFLFSGSPSPADDGRIIAETLAEARLTDELGFDVIWLAEHHFDGICAYVDPVAFAAALSQATSRARIGFAVAQMSLHHPIRFAEQMALIDHMSGGRLIVGLGRGTAYNIYDYQGYGIDPKEAQDRFEEAEALMIEAWKGGPVDHDGTFFKARLPALRPVPLTKPHPYVLRAASTEHGMLDIARRQRPFMMNVQPDHVIRQRLDLYRSALAGTGLDAAAIEGLVGECWVWRNVLVADTDAEAERIAVPAFKAMIAARAAMRDKVLREQGVSMVAPPVAGQAPAARTTIEHGIVFGSPRTVAEKLAPVARTGVGGAIMQFRIGPMGWPETERSLRLFRREVMPLLQ